MAHPMTHSPDSPWDSTDAEERPDEAVETVEAYEDGGRIVLYDANNPLGWIESNSAISLADLP